MFFANAQQTNKWRNTKNTNERGVTTLVSEKEFMTTRDNLFVVRFGCVVGNSAPPMAVISFEKMNNKRDSFRNDGNNETPVAVKVDKKPTLFYKLPLIDDHETMFLFYNPYVILDMLGGDETMLAFFYKIGENSVDSLILPSHGLRDSYFNFMVKNGCVLRNVK